MAATLRRSRCSRSSSSLGISVPPEGSTDVRRQMWNNGVAAPIISPSSSPDTSSRTGQP
jgi:hypothetical protein